MTPQEDLIARLKAVVPYQGKSNVAFLCHEAAEAIAAQAALLSEAREAVRPFSTYAPRGNELVVALAGHDGRVEIRGKHFMDASALLAKLEPKP